MAAILPGSGRHTYGHVVRALAWHSVGEARWLASFLLSARRQAARALGRDQLVERDGQISNALSGGVVHSVEDCGGNTVMPISPMPRARARLRMCVTAPTAETLVVNVTLVVWRTSACDVHKRRDKQQRSKS